MDNEEKLEHDDAPEELKEIVELYQEMGYEDFIVLRNPDFTTAIEGMSEEGRLIYDYDKMVEFLMNNDGIDETEAIEFIDYNTIRALPYMGEKRPIVMHRSPVLNTEEKENAK